jgi:hypothetical protein
MKLTAARSIICLAIFASLVLGQSPRVHQQYFRTEDVIVVKTDRLVLVDTANQFLDVQFFGRSSKSSPEMPARVTVNVYSRALATRYEKDDGHRLTITGDELTLNIGLMDYMSLKEIDSNRSDR